MKRILVTLFASLAIQQSLYAETLYGLELAPPPMREKHLAHFVELFQEYCFGQASQESASKNLTGSDRFRPAKDYEGVYEEYFEGFSYAITPDPDVCTTDIMLEYQTGQLLFSLEEVQSAISRHTNYAHTLNENKTEEGPNSETVLTVESHFQNNKSGKKEIVLTYPTSNQDAFYMTLDYRYE